MKLDSLRFLPLIFVLFTGVVASCSTPGVARKACDDPGPVLAHGRETGLDACSGGLIHRSKIVACPTVEPEGVCALNPARPGSCGSNADCTKALPGTVCAPATQSDGCSCLDTCVTDAECGGGQMCRCDGRVAFCTKALCASDAVCPPGRLCVFTDFASCDVGGVQGFACQTDLDECLTSLDCADRQVCAYTGDHRICAKALCM